MKLIGHKMTFESYLISTYQLPRKYKRRRKVCVLRGKMAFRKMFLFHDFLAFDIYNESYFSQK